MEDELSETLSYQNAERQSGGQPRRVDSGIDKNPELDV
jgi:hypothetical protein